MKLLALLLFAIGLGTAARVNAVPISGEVHDNSSGNAIVTARVTLFTSDLRFFRDQRSTGAGKSVCINAIITSLLYRFSPDQLRFVMIDPKVVELQHYNSLPHLVVPVVTDPKKVILALRWVTTIRKGRSELLMKPSRSPSTWLPKQMVVVGPSSATPILNFWAAAVRAVSCRLAKCFSVTTPKSRSSLTL